MKFLILAALPTVLLSGCVFQTINDAEIAAATAICARRGSSVQEISSFFSGGTSVKCKDLTTEFITPRTLAGKD